MDLERIRRNKDHSCCPTCLDLRYEVYKRLNIGMHLDLYTRAQGCRYHAVSFSEVEQAATEGCPFCSILQKGIDKCWSLPKDRVYVPADPSEKEQVWDLCIEIRPGCGLLLSKIGGSCMKSLKGEWAHDDCGEVCSFRSYRTPIEFFTLDATEPFHKSFGPSVDIPTAPGLDYIRKTLSVWLSECDRKHSSCGPSDPHLEYVCPKRLVQVAGGEVRLVEPDPDSKVVYTTLSHCWGFQTDAADLFKTTITNIASLRKSIDWDDVPRTFRDAIEVTRLVSCDYIWIDSLCIIQDDNEDWKEQAAQMAKVYSNSYLNIAATSADNCSGGLFHPRVWCLDPLFTTETRTLKSYALGHDVFVRPQLHQVHEAFFGPNKSRFEKQPHENPFPLLRRAWVFQERILSRRTIHFTRSEMLWECRAHTTCECGEYDDSDTLGFMENVKTAFDRSANGQSPTKDILKVWRTSVAKYSHLNMTISKDWPYAIAGLASRLLPCIRSNYSAGLWEIEFPECLFWGAHDVPITNYDTTLRGWPFHSLTFPEGSPTWSWLNCRAATRGVEGQILMSFAQGVINDNFKFEFGNPTDSSRDVQEAGFRIDHLGSPLYLEGLLSKGHVKLDPAKTYFILESVSDNDSEGYRHLGISFLDFQFPQTLANTWYPVSCLFVWFTRGMDWSLVLAAVPGTDYYIRIGHATSDSVSGMFKDAKVCRIEVR